MCKELSDELAGPHRNDAMLQESASKSTKTEFWTVGCVVYFTNL